MSVVQWVRRHSAFSHNPRANPVSRRAPRVTRLSRRTPRTGKDLSLRLAAVAGALLILSGCASLSKGELAVVAVSAGDIATTEALLARDGYVEGNPLMKEQAIRLAAKAAATAGVIHIHRKFKRKGEHGKAKAVLIIAASVWGGAFIWNAHHLRGTR